MEHTRSHTRLLALLCALVVGLGLISSPGSYADDLKDKQKTVKKQIRSAKGQLAHSSAALETAQARLTTARTKLAAAQEKLAATRGELAAAKTLDQQMQARLAGAEQALATAREELAIGRANVVEQRADIGRLAAQNYQYGDPGLMRIGVIFSAEDTQELTTRLNTVENMMDRQNQLYDDLKATEARLVVQERKVETARQAVAAERAAAAKNLTRKQQLEKAAAGEQHQVAVLVASSKELAAKAKKLRKADQARLRELRKEEKRIKEKILARAARQTGGYTGSSGGFLTRPVPGRVTSPYGYRRHPIYGYWGLHNGIDFSAPCGSPMVAAASGTVIEAYRSSVYGNRLYIDLGKVNGKNMTIVYNHATSYRVGVGDHVKRGEVVGYAGATGWATGCHLHFIVMIDGETTNPAAYL